MWGVMEAENGTRPASAGSLSTFAGEYLAKTRQFSRNANLYVLHVIGMDMIHGSFTVLFNLYLLAVGFDVRFIGLRLMIGFVGRAVTAIPAGLVSDRIGRKASFILGDGVGAIIGLVMINTGNEAVLLAGPALGAFFGNLHQTSEAAFMMENSERSERVHLFSVAGSFRTLSAMTGMLIAGFVPTLFIDDFGRVDAYRYATYAGLGLWFVSLIPALMLRPVEAVELPRREGSAATSAKPGLTTLFSGIRHRRHIVYFVVTSAILAFGVGAVVPLMNVVLQDGHLHADEAEIGIVFALGELGLAVATLFVPLLAARMLKVDAIAMTRLLALPFVLGMALLPLALDEGVFLLLLFGAAHMGRVMTFRLSGPLDDAFNMEVLDARERATGTGIEIAAGGAVSAVAILIGSQLMDSGDYATPFLILGACYLVSTLIYWRVFRPVEVSEERARSAELALEAEAVSAG
jgi:MFS family permease